MQIYKDYVLMRLVFCSLTILFLLTWYSHALAMSTSDNPMATPLDSLVAHWAKEQTSMPYYAYGIKDFNDEAHLSEEKSFIVRNGIGAVAISNGKMDEIESWNKKMSSKMSIPPLFIAEITTVFELPFEYVNAPPSHLEVLSVSNDSLAFYLGLNHGLLLKKMGFNVAKLTNEPKYLASPEWKKVALYFDGLKEAGLFFFLSAQDEMFIHLIGWSHIVIYSDDFEGTSRFIKKSRKKNRKEKSFQGLYMANYDSMKTMEMKENLFYEGAGLVMLPYEVGECDSKPMKASKSNVQLLKKPVRDYFSIWKKIKATNNERSAPMNQDSLCQVIHDQSKILLLNKDSIIPIGSLSQTRIYTLFENSERGLHAQELVDYYKTGQHFDRRILNLNQDSLLKVIPENGLLLIDFNSLIGSEELDSVILKLEYIQHQRKVIALLRGNANRLKLVSKMKTVLWSPGARHESLIDLVQMAFGSEKILGQLPMYLHKDWGHQGELTENVTRLKYQNVSMYEIDHLHLANIDSIVTASIQNQEMPGCQIMMLHKGSVVYNKTFGYLSYDSLLPVQWQSIYDIASVTKTTATVPLVMHALEQNLIEIEDSLYMYYDELKDSDKARISLSSLLCHQSGLKSYYPFWKDAQYDSVRNLYPYKKIKSKRKKIYEYFNINWEDSVNAWVGKSDFTILRNPDSTYGYLYSDLGFMLLKQIVERKSKRNFDQLADSILFKPLGMDHTMYNAYRLKGFQSIAPTEDDAYFRNRMLVGEVHDKNAALLGGVAGHAGLFSNANDLAKYMQMIMRKGNYGGIQFFDPLTIVKFTTKPEASERRALGWDKPNYSVGNTSKYASEASFGHSGFTGTLVWADPVYDLVYVFLSNRIHPDPQNYQLIESNTRTKIHDIMYESIISSDIISVDDL